MIEWRSVSKVADGGTRTTRFSSKLTHKQTCSDLLDLVHEARKISVIHFHRYIEESVAKGLISVNIKGSETEPHESLFSRTLWGNLVGLQGRHHCISFMINSSALGILPTCQEHWWRLLGGPFACHDPAWGTPGPRHDLLMKVTDSARSIRW